jgi:hypothetical protein
MHETRPRSAFMTASPKNPATWFIGNSFSPYCHSRERGDDGDEAKVAGRAPATMSAYGIGRADS